MQHLKQESKRSFDIHLRGFFSSITAHVAAAVIPPSATSSKTSSGVPIGVILATRVRPLARASAQAARTAEARRLRDDQRLNSAGPAHAPSPRASPATAPGSRRGHCRRCSTGRFSLARRGGRIQCIGGSRSSIACCFPRSCFGRAKSVAVMSATHFFVALACIPDLLLCAKHLSFSADEASRSVRFCPSTVCVLLRIGGRAGGLFAARPQSAHYGWGRRPVSRPDCFCGPDGFRKM
jgi:hypothetical protein